MNLSKKQTPLIFRHPQTRINDFDEVSSSYSLLSAKEEAYRCLNCKNAPCQNACPLHNNIPQFIKSIVDEEDISKTRAILRLTTIFPSICGRVCPHPCEKACVRGKNGDSVGIRNLERYVGDEELVTISANHHEERIGIIGAGPAGLSCAYELLKEDYSVIIYDENEFIGGALSYESPSYRLPYESLNNLIKTIENLKGEFRLQSKIEGDIVGLMSRDHLDMLFIASGANVDKKMGISGEDLPNVYQANYFLKEVRKCIYASKYDELPLKNAKNVIVVGGGNVAIDAARTARRLGANVTIMYRRSEEEMPAYKEEIKEAKEEGVEFLFLTLPKAILGDNSGLTAIEYVKMSLEDIDSSGRRSVKEIPSSLSRMDNVDGVIIAISARPNLSCLKDTSLVDIDSWGGIIVDQNGQTSCSSIFSGGDVVDGPLTVVNAIKKGKDAASAIIDTLKKRKDS